MRLHRAAWRAALALTACVTLAGCAGLPTAGPIHHGDAEPEPTARMAPPEGPVPGDLPEGVVQSFIAACAGGGDDGFKAATEHLAPEAATTWVPMDHVTVYSQPLQVHMGSADEATVSANVTATIDSAGIYTEAEPGTVTEFTFGVAKNDDGQYRITSLENGILVSADALDQSFTALNVYFLDRDDRSLVPEQHWYPSATAPVGATMAVLAGPSSPTLKDVLHTAAPAGTRLTAPSVTVSDKDGSAAIDLSAEALNASPEDRVLLMTQLNATLTQIPKIQGLAPPTVNGAEYAVDRLMPNLVRDPTVGTAPVVVANGAIADLVNGAIVPTAGVAPLANPAVSALAVSMDRRQFAVLAPDGTGQDAITVYNKSTSENVDPAAPAGSPGGPGLVVLSGAGLTAPSFDTFGWLWTTPAACDGTITAIGPSPYGVQRVQAPAFEGRTILDVRVARDGARAAIVSSDAGRARIDLVGIVRDGQGVPQRLTTSTRIGADVASPTAVSWVDESTLWALGASSSTGARAPFEVALGGQSRPRALLDDPVTIAAGKGDLKVYALSGDSTLAQFSGNTWDSLAHGVTAVAFPG